MTGFLTRDVGFIYFPENKRSNSCLRSNCS